MNNHPNLKIDTKKMKRTEIFALIWIIAALAVIYPVTVLLQGAFPVFTWLLLGVPLIALLRFRNAAQIGIRRVPWREVLKYAGLTLAGALILMAAFEPWSHTYQGLVQKALASPTPDTTFAWLTRFPGVAGWLGLALYSGLVTLFAEELFFRGWLLQLLKKRMKFWPAVLVQAACFTLLQALAALLLPPLQGALYAGVYSFLAIGVLGGWAAGKTDSIWPSLIMAVVYNLVMCAWVLG
jgi:membrane protease YdiL (CAAX protease family)